MPYKICIPFHKIYILLEYQISTAIETLCCCCCIPSATILICQSSCPGPESSVPVSSMLVCPISSHVTDQSTELVSLYIGYWTLNNYYYYYWDEPCYRTGEVLYVDPFYSLTT